jgi:hypothetical protein
MGIEDHKQSMGYLGIACNEDVHVKQHLARYNMTMIYGYRLSDT